MKVLTVFGTRPEVIKMAPVVKELEKYPNGIQSVVCATAQHREMLDQMLNVFDGHRGWLGRSILTATAGPASALWRHCWNDLSSPLKPRE